MLYSDGSRKTTHSILLYCCIGALVGFNSAGLNFLAQIGQINGAGISGMFDIAMGKMLIGTQLGDVTFYRLLGFAVAFLSSCYFLVAIQNLSKAPGLGFFRRIFTLNSLGLIVLVLSFRLIGHVSVLSLIAQFALAIHVLVFAFWIGALYPLYLLAKVPDTTLVQQKLALFGQHGVLLTASLLVAGGLMLWELFHSWAEFVSSAYGLSILFKLLLVVVILAIAAFNKLRFVPGLTSGEGARRFRRSVVIEGGVAVLILMLTAYLSTVIGPAGMDH